MINRTGTVGETVSGALTPYLIDNTSLIVMNDHLESKLFFHSFRTANNFHTFKEFNILTHNLYSVEPVTFVFFEGFLPNIEFFRILD